MTDSKKARLIFDTLDAHQYKQALKLCEGALKKEKKGSPNLIMTTIKSLCMEKLGRREEAEKIAQEVINQSPTDEQVLNTLYLICKGLGKFDLLALAYENAYKKNPKSEDLLLGVFAAYTRIDNVVKQKEIALLLNRTFPKPRYTVWLIVAIFLQVVEKGPNTILDLAERMCEKLITEGKIDSFERLGLYLDIISQKLDYSKMLEVTKGKLGELFKIENEKLAYQADLHRKLSQNKEAHDIYKSLLERWYDDWSYWVGYFETGFIVAKQNNSSSAFIEESKKLIKSTQEKFSIVRGPYLAELELICLQQEQDGTSPDRDEVARLLTSYFQRFGEKPCCFPDLKKYISKLLVDKSDDDSNKRLISTFCETLKSLTEKVESEEEQKNKIKKIHKLVSYYQISRYSGLYRSFTQEQKISLINELMSIWKVSTSVEKEVTELGTADEIAIIAAHTLVEIHAESKNIVHLLEAVTILERAVSYSKHGFQIKLYLLRLYNRLGALRSGFVHWNSLDIKHILLDTLSYALLDDELRYGFNEEATQHCGMIQHFHDDNTKGTAEHIIRAFHHESYSRVKEFKAFKSKLEHSQQLMVSRVENNLLELQKNSNSLLETEAFLKTIDNEFATPLSEQTLSSLTMNQDYNILNNYDPAQGTSSTSYASFKNSAVTSAETLNRSTKDQLDLLQLRSLIVPSIKSLFSKDSAKLEAYVKEMKDLVTRLKFEVDAKEEITKSSKFDSVNWNFIISLFETSKSFMSSSEQPGLSDSLLAITKVFTALSKRSLDQLTISSNEKEILDHANLPELVMLTNETATWATFVVQFWVKWAVKKGSDVKSNIKEFQSSLHSFFKSILAIKAELAKSLSCDIGLSVAINEEDRKQGYEKIIEDITLSYAESITKLQKVATNKSNVLSAIKIN